MAEQKNPHTVLHLKKPWVDNENTIWLASTLKLYRNVEKFVFPGKLSEDKRKQIASLISKGLEGLPGLVHPVVFKAEEMDPLDKEYLLEHYLSMQSFHHAHATEGFVIDDSGEFLAIINIDDHVQVQITDCHGEIEKSWNRLADIETSLGRILNFAFSPQFGFLTADPAHCGTGLSVHVFLHLPGLIHGGQLQTALQKSVGEGVSVTGMQGDPLNRIGDVIAIHNTYTLGLTEEDIVSSLRNAVTKLVVAEKSMRTHIRTKDTGAIKDKVSRAYGVLMHSYQLETIEAMNALSLLKLGLDLEWLKGIGSKELNALFFNCRRAHLVAQFDQKDIPPEQLPHKRAELIHAALKPAQLTI